MPPPNLSPLLLLLLLLLLVLLSISTPCISSPLFSTIAISHVSNQTVICALFPSHANNPYELNCTSFPKRAFHSYPSGSTLYSAIAAGNGFLCAVGSPGSSELATMRWWDFTQRTKNGSTPDSKRVYLGPPLSMLAAGESRVCGLTGDTGGLECWRWPHLSLPKGLNFTRIAVGGSFVCGLLDSGAIRCFGNDTAVVGNVPAGNYTIVAARTRHACGISNDGDLLCWGAGAGAVPPQFDGKLYGITSLALGDNRTCARQSNGTVLCWGADDNMPKDIVGAQFMAIAAKGTDFCGILMANYSLVCWGSEAFHQNHLVFDRVLPGSCTAISSCPCGVLAGSEAFCVDGGVVCHGCNIELNANPSPSPSNPTNSTLVSHGSGNGREKLVLIIVGSVGLAVAVVVVASLFLFWVKKKSGRVYNFGTPAPPPAGRRAFMEEGTNPPLSAFISKGPSSTVQEFPLHVLLEATDGFSEDYKIGSGSFGAVYRATLDDGQVVAIKRAEPSASSSHAAEDRRRNRESAFLSELGLLSRVNHKNLVRLLGFCKEGSERVLVYEFMPNGTLHDHLHKFPSSPLSSWVARLRVALDAARGIEYLHTYAVPPIIHRDIKSSNILLDESWTSKVSDFGLSLMTPDVSGVGEGSHVSLRAAGTVGYMDPEYYRLQQLTAKSDVYSFGVVLLELLSGCRAIHRHDESGTPRNVVEFAVPLIEADDVHRMLDKRLPPPTPSEIEAVAYVGCLAADCVIPRGVDRPTMTETVGGLEQALSACLAPARPFARSTTTRSM